MKEIDHGSSPYFGSMDLAPVVQKLDNAIHRINHYPVDSVYLVDSVVCFAYTAIYLVDSVIQPLNNWGLVCLWRGFIDQGSLFCTLP